MNTILQFFIYQHLPTHLQEVSKPFCELANWIVDKIVTTRRYKLYIINEYGQKEYLSMELSKVK